MIEYIKELLTRFHKNLFDLEKKSNFLTKTINKIIKINNGFQENIKKLL
jgi:hypothetical protein